MMVLPGICMWLWWFRCFFNAITLLALLAIPHRIGLAGYCEQLFWHAFVLSQGCICCFREGFRIPRVDPFMATWLNCRTLFEGTVEGLDWRCYGWKVNPHCTTTILSYSFSLSRPACLRVPSTLILGTDCLFAE